MTHKSIARDELSEYIEELLQIRDFQDSCINGLEVEGRPQVTRVAAAVDCGLSVVEEAAAKGADFLLVHHGLYWGRSVPATGAHRQLLERCFASGLNIFAAHLPLDAHEEVGNNFILARQLSLTSLERAVPYEGSLIGCRGQNTAKLTCADFESRLRSLHGGGNVVSLPFGPKIPERVCIVTGSAADTLYTHREIGFDTFITGEPRQFAYHLCREQKLNAFFAGHYATETLGVRALARHLSEKFGIEEIFVDQPTGI